jgi:hypothetical protein
MVNCGAIIAIFSYNKLYSIMKKLAFLLLGAMGISALSCAQNAPASPPATAEGKNVKVAYGQPSKKGREIFGKLVPYGEVWRAGANNATEITFATDGMFGGQAIKAGTYSLFALPTETEWTIILNSTLKQWGAYGYGKIKDKDVAKVKVPVAKLSGVVEKLTYRFIEGNMIIEWDQTQVSVPVSF